LSSNSAVLSLLEAVSKADSSKEQAQLALSVAKLGEPIITDTMTELVVHAADILRLEKVLTEQVSTPFSNPARIKHVFLKPVVNHFIYFPTISNSIASLFLFSQSTLRSLIAPR